MFFLLSLFYESRQFEFSIKVSFIDLYLYMVYYKETQRLKSSIITLIDTYILTIQRIQIEGTRVSYLILYHLKRP